MSINNESTIPQQLNGSELQVREKLSSVFGYQSFRPYQEEVINCLVQGGDAFVLMPTGGGKSICFQIPALCRAGVAIVVSPLISLMKDQVDGLQANGVRAACYNSSLGAVEARQVLTQLHAGQLDLLYVAPERLLSGDFLGRLKNLELSLFAIDEAHCVSQWGHDFRPEYVGLGRLRDIFPAIPMVALTATAEKQTRIDIAHHLQLHNAHQVVASFDRPNIRYTVIDKAKPYLQLSAFLDNRQEEAGIVYCLSRKRVDEVAAKLQQDGLQAAAYHAGLPAAERKRVQEAFIRDDIQIVVATVAFGMGIDKPNVRFVVHYDLPKNLESYYQETGRAGRDGLPAEALLLFGYGDIAISRGLIEKGGNPEQKRIEIHKLNAMVGFAESGTCRRRALLGYFGENLVDDCDNCDICLNPPERYDASEDARKALSCVYRVGQRFGIGHVIEVLRGAKTQRIFDLRHEQLSTYGIGREQSQDHWSHLLRQLIHCGYLEQDIGNYSVLKLTEAARPLLRGETELTITRPRVKTSRKKRPQPKIVGLEYDQELFNLLRVLRKQIADRDGVPPYVVFGDASLAEMAATLPTDEEAFLQINGVGQKKLQSYGNEFMAEIIGFMCR
ncbi:MAG: DNA helicase RecQ [Desulfuromonadales bacterium]|nr:DNA helicase RecQ [Desulfuromonadales bacterium]